MWTLGSRWELQFHLQLKETSLTVDECDEDPCLLCLLGTQSDDNDWCRLHKYVRYEVPHLHLLTEACPYPSSLRSCFPRIRHSLPADVSATILSQGLHFMIDICYFVEYHPALWLADYHFLASSYPYVLWDWLSISFWPGTKCTNMYFCVLSIYLYMCTYV